MAAFLRCKNFQKLLPINRWKRCMQLSPSRRVPLYRFSALNCSSATNLSPQAPNKHTVVRRCDYVPPPFLVKSVDLDFDIYDGHTIVTNSMVLHSNPAGRIVDNALVLDGDTGLELQSISINGHACEFHIADDGCLHIPLRPQFYNERHEIPMVLQNRITPEKNTSLEGLYKSSAIYCTQCEAEGFRKITFFPDRPDVTASFTTTIHANRAQCPVLLSNGNCVDAGVQEDDDTRHWSRWHDPFHKPCYLFALVAGDLQSLDASFTTHSQRQVALKIYSEAHNLDKCAWAMQSLQQSMAWDEQRFGLEYDLDSFNIVAVDDFNMGAMENKSLNIFNTKYVLASSDTATDGDYHAIQAVIGHEYFHNYTGNRVTCRDWFQLSLKEGLTVFRDQEFSADLNDAGVERIDQVQQLQATQFKEDAGPMAHAVRPDEYIEINNFYTTTVYEKGAEIVRMIQSVIGRDKFKQGLRLYLSRHDGEACTIEQFIQCMHEASGFDLQQMLTSWYSQCGTPEVEVDTRYDAQQKTFSVTLQQRNPNPKSENAYLIPLKLSLLNRQMDEQHTVPYELLMDADSTHGPIWRILLLREPAQTFTFYNIDHEPLLSINRGFTAPVYVQHSVSMQDLNVLAVKDTDPFNRWNSCNKLLSVAILKDYQRLQSADGDEEEEDDESAKLNPFVEDTFKRLLHRFIPEKTKQGFKAEQDANKRKQILRDKRRQKTEKSTEQQFLLQNNKTISDEEYAYKKSMDISDEKFIEDLIGKSDEGNGSKIARNPLLTSRLLCLPSFNYLFGLLADDEGRHGVDPELLLSCMVALKCDIGLALYPQLLNSYTWSRDQLSMLSLYPNYSASYKGYRDGRSYRSLLNMCLSYLVAAHPQKNFKHLKQSASILFEQYQLARNMTEMFGAMSALVNSHRRDMDAEKQEILAHFYKHFESDKLVVQKWLRLQATASDANALSTVHNLLGHKCFEALNPNFIYSVVGAFAFANPLGFHQQNGDGYQFLSDQILHYDPLNASVAARLCKAYEMANKLDANRQQAIHQQLERILRSETLSKGSYEVASKIVNSFS